MFERKRVARSMKSVFESNAYRGIKEFYGDKVASRSQVPLINHIDEGLLVMALRDAGGDAMEAYCLHPLVQCDYDLHKNFHTFYELADVEVSLMALEYRNIANSYLSRDYESDDDVVTLSPIRGVNEMLVADKVQNFKDFVKHHHGVHKNSSQLSKYFKRWFKALGVSYKEYQDYAACIENYCYPSKERQL